MFLIKHKFKIFEKFRKFRHKIEKQIRKPIKVLQFDREGKYLSIEFLGYLKKNGLVSQWTPPDIPQLNRISERRNKTPLDMV